MRDATHALVKKTYSIRSALEILDLTAGSILLLVDDQNVLLRTISDGDIRRLLIAGFAIDDTLDKLPSQSYISVNLSTSKDEVLILMKHNLIYQVPILDNHNKPIGIYLKDDLEPNIQLSIPHMGGLERQYVEEAFDSNWIAPLGPNVDGFEKEFSEYIGGSYATAVNSGTSAIHLALILLGIVKDDIVLCSSFTFVASANPILYQAAIPIFIDSEPKTWNMCPLALKQAIESTIKAGKKPKAIIVAHLYGQSADMNKIMELSNYFSIPVIEDSAESLGSLYKGKHTGTIGNFGIFSFNGNKIITTSGGGMLISNDKEMIIKAQFLSTQARNDKHYYEHTEVGYNYRMSNILAGIGRGQLKVLDQRVSEKRDIYDYYQKNLLHDALEWMPQPEGDYSNRWLSVVSINPNKTNTTPRELIRMLKEKNIEARHVWKPMHLQPLFSECKYFKSSDKSFCDYLFNSGVCLPSASNMSKAKQEFVVSEFLKTINNVF